MTENPLIIPETTIEGAPVYARLAPAQALGAPPDELEEKVQALRARIAELGGLVVGFSAGVDSTFLLKVAFDVLGDRCVALTAVSPSLPRREREAAMEIAASIGATHVLRESDEIHNPKYLANPKSRCFYCKMALFDLADDVMASFDIPHMAIGTNLSDLGDHRPGTKAADQRGVLHPLVETGFTKDDIREASRRLGLSVWNKAEFACLSSRFPYGTVITEERLNQIETCEDVPSDLGFEIFRVRYHDDLVRIELGQDEIGRAFEPEVREPLLERCKAAGFKYISIDLQGYRRGSMNE